MCLQQKFYWSNLPGQHKVILGDSTKKVQQYIQENSGITFDLILINGGY